MSGLVAGRLALGILALVAAGRARRARGMALAGVAGAAAAFGTAPLDLPAPVAVGAGLLAASLLLTLLRSSLHSPIAAEAACSTAAVAAAGAGVAALALRGAGPWGALAGAGAVGTALSAWGAAGCLANAEAGARRGAWWTIAVVLPPSVAGAVLALHGSLPSGSRAIGVAAAGLAALLGWVAPFALERRRVLAELAEEARLGILPEEDLPVLGNPWRRSREPRFGRSDERREYVRSALLLAVARQQQRRRSGEAIRLRQLEVLAFRTRVRRAVEGRLSRFGPAADEAAV